jgi:hypothetical protein
MPCAYASTFRAGQPWDKPGHDGEGGAHRRPDGYPAAFAHGLGVTNIVIGEKSHLANLVSHAALISL